MAISYQVGLIWVEKVNLYLWRKSPVTRSHEDPVSSPVKSFESLYSSQSSEEGVKETKMIPYDSPLKETGVVQFEDTFSEDDGR